jgi:hypothetical protein
VPSKRIIAAATRFREAWDASLRSDRSVPLSDIDIVEMHDAALGLIAATSTETLHQALAVLHAYERE